MPRKRNHETRHSHPSLHESLELQDNVVELFVWVNNAQNVANQRVFALDWVFDDGTRVRFVGIHFEVGFGVQFFQVLCKDRRAFERHALVGGAVKQEYRAEFQRELAVMPKH